MIDQEELRNLQSILQTAKTVGILVSANPNSDTMAAGLALYLSLTLSGKNVSIICKSEPLVEVSNLVGIDKVEQKLSLGGSDLTVSLPYKQGTIEKISYNIEGDRINLVVKAGQAGLDFDESDIVYQRNGGQADVIFAIGMAQSSMVYEFVAQNGEQKPPYIINIDNDSANARFGNTFIVDPSASSKSEIVASLLSMLKLPIDRDLAQNLLIGIDFATNNFQDPKTSALAFEMAGLLLKNGAMRDSKHKKRFVSQDELGGDFPPEAFFPPMPMSKPQNVSHLEPPMNTVKPSPQSQKDPQGGFNRQAWPVGSQGKKKQPPADWLTPKIYKGSTTV